AQVFQHRDRRLRRAGGRGSFGRRRGGGRSLVRGRAARGRRGAWWRIRTQLRQQAIVPQLRVDDFVERAGRRDHRLLETLQQQQPVFQRQVQAGDRGAQGVGET